MSREAVRQFYRQAAKDPNLPEGYRGRDWKQLKSMTHLEEFREAVPGSGKGTNACCLLTKQEDPLDGSAGRLGCKQKRFSSRNKKERKEMNRRKRAAAAVIAIILVAAMVVPLVIGALA